MSLSKHLGFLIASAFLALLAFAPGDARNTHAGTAEPPPNDDFASATVISELPFTDTVDIGGATVEANEASPSCNFGGVFSTVWYRYTPPEDILLVTGASTGGANTAMAVWTEGDSGFEEVDCDGFPGAALAARLAFQAQASVTYFFQVDVLADDPSVGTTFTLASATPPANDDFIDATEISSLPFSDAQDTGAATEEKLEPVACIGGKFGVPPVASVWYAFTPEEDTVVVADTTGSDFDTVINVLLPGDLGPISVGCASSRTSLPPVRVGFEAVAGQLYYFQVGGARFDLAFGSLSFNLSVGVAPANDDFNDVIDVGALPFEVGVDTIAAGVQTDEPAPSCASRGVASSVWYRISAAEHSLIVAEATGSGPGVVMGVYEGESLAGLTQVVCGEPRFPSTTVGFEAAAGETYYLQVAGVLRKRTVPSMAGVGEVATFGSGGNLVFRITSREIPSCPAPELSIEDRTDDVRIFLTPPEPGRRHDILSTSVSMTNEHVCLRFDFAAPVDPPDAGTEDAIDGRLFLDTDSNRRSGFTPFLCGWEREFGVDVSFDFADGSGQFLRPRGGGGPQDGRFVIALFEERSMTLIFPQEVIGGDSAFRFVAQVKRIGQDGEDCTPDRSFIQVPPPALGDANCDGHVDSVDAVVILQFFARLSESLPCESVADANGNGTIGSIDAALILQLDAGLIDFLPAAASEAIAAVIRATAVTLSIPEDQVIVRSVNAETWPNGCLGLPEPGEACTEALVDGYRIRLKGWLVPLPAPTPPSPTAVPAEFYSWRTNLDGSQIRLEGIAIP